MSCFHIFTLDQPTVEELINHPVHITDTKSISSFIPFCSFGTNTNGKFVGNISLPVCDLFKEKIINGQLCYEADVDHYMKGIDDWMQTLETGFNFIIDFNEEYDVKNFIQKGLERRLKNNSSLSLYKQTDNEGLFDIRLQTISMS